MSECVSPLPLAPLPLLRLLQLNSPSLPIGGFTYSQGLEWAVEAGWVDRVERLDEWLHGQLQYGLARVDLPLLLRLQQAAADADWPRFNHWSGWLLACRESGELRLEEQQRGRALLTLLRGLDLAPPEAATAAVARTQAAGVAWAARCWQIDTTASLLGYGWSWLEQQVLAGVKLIPLGQTAGQRLLMALAKQLPAAVATAKSLPDHAIGSSLPALAIASAQHEQQYTRLFRS